MLDSNVEPDIVVIVAARASGDAGKAGNLHSLQTPSRDEETTVLSVEPPQITPDPNHSVEATWRKAMTIKTRTLVKCILFCVYVE